MISSFPKKTGRDEEKPFCFQRMDVLAPSGVKPTKGLQVRRDPLEGISFAELEELDNNSESMLRHAKQIQSAIEKYRKILQKWQKMLKSGQFEVSPEDMIKNEEDALSCFFTELDALFRIAIKRPMRIAEKDHDQRPKLFLPGERDISVIIENDCVFVKTPPLFNRNRHWFGKGQVDYFELFSTIVEQKMLEKMAELPCYTKKNVNGLFVYETGNWEIPDADNVDTKKIVDAITRFLPGGDSGNTCSFSFASIRSNELAPGAYFTISKGFAVQPDFLENYFNLIQIFGT